MRAITADTRHVTPGGGGLEMGDEQIFCSANGTRTGCEGPRTCIQRSSGRNSASIFEKLPLCPLAIELNSFLLVYINFRNSNLLMQGGFAFIWQHYAGEKHCFVDLSLTPTRFLASNFLITAEHEFSLLKDTT